MDTIAPENHWLAVENALEHHAGYLKKATKPINSSPASLIAIGSQAIPRQRRRVSAQTATAKMKTYSRTDVSAGSVA